MGPTICHHHHRDYAKLHLLQAQPWPLNFNMPKTQLLCTIQLKSKYYQSSLPKRIVGHKVKKKRKKGIVSPLINWHSIDILSNKFWAKTEEENIVPNINAHTTRIRALARNTNTTLFLPPQHQQQQQQQQQQLYFFCLNFVLHATYEEIKLFNRKKGKYPSCDDEKTEKHY